MQCANCHFENMPGVDACGRCGASLRLAAAAINVHPPRAGPWAKRWRPLIPWLRRHWFNFRRSSLPDVPEIDWSRWTGTFPDAPVAAVLVRMLVPGWPQRYFGRVRRGQVMFWVYLAALLLGLVFAGTTSGATLLGLALAVHAASILDVVMNEPGTSLRAILGRSAFCLLILTVAIYLPAAWLVTRVATPQQFVMDSPPFAAGDVVLYAPLAYWRSAPKPGDVVICDIPQSRIALPGLHANVVNGGLQVERLLAGPGSKVLWADGQLTVDDRPAEWLPFSFDSMPKKFSLVVPPNSYLIVPPPIAYGEVHGMRYDFPAPFRAATIVTRATILGRVYFRTQPLWRMGPIR